MYSSYLTPVQTWHEAYLLTLKFKCLRQLWELKQDFLFSIIAVFNLFSKGLVQVAVTNQTSGTEPFARSLSVDCFQEELCLSCLVVSSYANLFSNKQEIDYYYRCLTINKKSTTKVDRNIICTNFIPFRLKQTLMTIISAIIQLCSTMI